MALPREAYTDQKWFENEMNTIFAQTWQFAGFVEDLQEQGDYLTVQCGFQNILVVHEGGQKLRAFHNLCRHRGTQLLKTSGKKQEVITCPYHDWVYSLTGELIHVPEEKTEFPNLKKGEICLHKAAVGIWRGMIWVNPNPKAKGLEHWFGDCASYLGPHNPERLIEYPGTRSEVIIKANWKVVVENYIDVYHLAHLHSNTLNMYNHSKAEFGFVGDHFMFKEPLSRKYKKHLPKLIPYKQIAETVQDDYGAYVPLLFPNTGLSETESSWSIFNIIPLSPEKTKVIIRSKLEPMTEQEYLDQQKSSNENWEKIMGSLNFETDKSKNDPLFSGDFMAEDIFVCEQQQKGFRNPLFSVGYHASNLEKSILEFHDVIRRWE